MSVLIPRQSAYLHVTPGRVRVKSRVVKRDAARAQQVGQELAALPGVHLARANATTGSILLHFDNRQWTADALIDLLRQRGYLTEPPVSAAVASQTDRDVFAACCALIGKELLSTAISRIFPHPIVSTLLAVV